MSQLRDNIIRAIRTVQDPEIPINLYDLGLIYDLDIDEGGGSVKVTMTLTTPNCPVAESMPGQVKKAVEGVDGINAVTVDLVWEPAWTREKMSEDAQLQLEMMGITWNDGRPSSGGTGLTVGGKRATKRPSD